MNICIVKEKHENLEDINLDDLNNLLIEKIRNEQVDEFDENLYIENMLFFNENYTYKQLIKIADFYKIKKSRKKEELINYIVLYEMDNNNRELVLRRKLYDYYLECLLEDEYYKKFIIIS